MATYKQGRDAKTGRFVDDAYVKTHKSTTVTETIKRGK